MIPGDAIEAPSGSGQNQVTAPLDTVSSATIIIDGATRSGDRHSHPLE
jgi:hypothetical protein